MFTITKQPQTEPVYILNDTDTQSSLTIYPDRGGIATSIGAVWVFPLKVKVVG